MRIAIIFSVPRSSEVYKDKPFGKETFGIGTNTMNRGCLDVGLCDLLSRN
jgi:hypothetical protein